jgi:hypothetical protein
MKKKRAPMEAKAIADQQALIRMKHKLVFIM